MNQVFQATLRCVAEYVAGKKGLRVVVRGRQALTTADGTVVVPVLDPKDPDAIPLARCYLDHEAAHQRETDFAAFEDAVRSLPPLGGPLLNCLEDARVERAIGRRFLGAAANLARGVEILAAQGKFSATPEDVEGLFQQLVVATARSVVAGQRAMEPVRREARERLTALGFPPGPLARIEDLVAQKGPGMASTADAVALTREILEVLEEEASPPPPSPESEEQSPASGPESGNDSDTGEGESSAGPESEDDAASSGTAAGDSPEESSGAGENDPDPEEGSGGSSASSPEQESAEPSGDGPSARTSGRPEESGSSDGESSPQGASSGDGAQKEGDATEPGKPGAGASSPKGPEASSAAGADDASSRPSREISPRDLLRSAPNGGDLGEMLREELSARAADEKAVDETPAVEGPPEEVLPPDTEGGPGGGTGWFVSVPVRPEDVARVTTGLRAQIVGLLEAERERYAREAPMGRRLHPGRLHRVAVGDPWIFRRKTRRPEIDTAVVVLSDWSDSMLDGKWQEVPARLAAPAVYGIMRVLRTTPGIASAAAAFPGGIRENAVVRLCGWDEPLRADRFGWNTRGGTPMTEALWWAFWQLYARRESRKVIFLVTDGFPNNRLGTREVLKKVIAPQGIEVYGLGILQRGLENVFAGIPGAFRVVDTLRDVPRAIYGMLRDSLVHGYGRGERSAA